MAKINLNGELWDYDFGHKPMSEALALEKATGKRYADWETELAAGSVEAMAGLVWLVWRRNGREVALDDILSGAIEVDLSPLLESLQAVAEEAQADGDPTASGTTPERTATTPPGTAPRSRNSSASGRGRSAS